MEEIGEASGLCKSLSLWLIFGTDCGSYVKRSGFGVMAGHQLILDGDQRLRGLLSRSAATRKGINGCERVSLWLGGGATYGAVGYCGDDWLMVSIGL
ncbi:unnamed protein product [Dovyalis caffra]|uniref:Uncharacterized protein n=1 Tax=Dovyalis caffra TaxID=77055 RepID=A0AAV1RZ77_9ROSI|nr:unnamed protein product [Dovyalis caffra]